MTKPPQDGYQRDGEEDGPERHEGARAQSDPDRMLTQPVQFYDRPPPPPGVQPYGPAASQYGQPGLTYMTVAMPPRYRAAATCSRTERIVASVTSGA